MLTPLRIMLEGSIGNMGTMENNTFDAMDRMMDNFDGTYNETRGTVTGGGTGEADIGAYSSESPKWGRGDDKHTAEIQSRFSYFSVADDEAILQYVKVLNATVFSTMQTTLARSGFEGSAERGNVVL